RPRCVDPMPECYTNDRQPAPPTSGASAHSTPRGTPHAGPFPLPWDTAGGPVGRRVPARRYAARRSSGARRLKGRNRDFSRRRSMVAAIDVVAAGLSPMKGTRHLSRPQVILDQGGPAGDREFCLVDAEAGTVLRTVQHPALLAVVVRWSGGQLEATVPGQPPISAYPEPAGGQIEAEYWGRTVTLELVGGPIAASFSRYLNRPVQLARAPRGGVVYGEIGRAH